MSDLGLFDAKPDRSIWDRQWNSRYVAYAHAHGMTPDEMAESDRIAYPGGPNYGFMTWMSGKWHEYDSEHGIREGTFRDDAMQADFDGWLEGR